ncbi:MAG: phosphonate metabolism protein/1,5-bisphosphokinase (PRPP-forming) PhnN [Sulfuritalea sp.]|nr:phosphonate metabolism protein/1,5-bisphosphokinase (PRPP-forming) PhnN [Sulfuritalea sp.]
MRLIYTVGPSGVGKDSLLNGLRQHVDAMQMRPPLHFAQRTITRNHDKSNEDHEAVNLPLFAKLQEENAFALAWVANGLHYGVRHTELQPKGEGAWVIVNGSRTYLDEARMRFPGLTVLYITAPIELLRQRLLDRGRESAADIEQRLLRAQSILLGPHDLCLSNGGTLEASGLALRQLLVQHTGLALLAE